MSSVYPAYARGSYVDIKYDGAALNLSKQLKSLSYTDNSSGSLDDITLVFDNRDNLQWCPEKGKDLDVTIILKNWYVNKQDLTYHCGNFCIDDITYSGAPRTITVKAISQPANSEFKETKRTKTWKNVTIRQIATEIMAKYGMTKLYYNANDVPVASIEQSDATDSDFLSKLCSKYGLMLKVYKVGLVIYDETMYEARNAFTFFGEYPDSTPYNTTDGYEEWPMHEIQPGWSWNTTLQGTYTGGQLKYTDAKTAKTFTATIGSPERLLIINEKADSLADAQSIVASKVNEENKKQVSMTFSPTLFNPFLFASTTIEIVNLGRPDGKYLVDKVSVSLSSSGLTQNVTLHKCMPRFDANGQLQQTEVQKKKKKKAKSK